MTFLRPIALAIVALCMSTGIANGNVLLVDTFDYQDDSLIGNGSWTNHSGTPGDLLVSGGQAIVQHGTPSEEFEQYMWACPKFMFISVFDNVSRAL